MDTLTSEEAFKHGLVFFGGLLVFLIFAAIFYRLINGSWR